jgi:hypothetical protein
LWTGSDNSTISWICLDRAGYPDRGRAVEAELQRLVQNAPLVSSNGRFAFFALIGCNQRQLQLIDKLFAAP